MTSKVKFVYVTRTIDPKTRIHYLDAIDENGQHWMAEMSHKEEPWLCFTDVWKKDVQVDFMDKKPLMVNGLMLIVGLQLILICLWVAKYG
jgi:hypothetical protein